MGKYIIDTDEWANLFEVRKVGVYGIGNDILTNEKTVWSRMFRLDELEELNSDYINEHYGELQDEAYRKGFEDGKKSVSEPDRIEVGDEVIYNGVTKCVVVTPETDVRYASLFDCNGIHYSADHRECKKTGKHYDIQSILEAMRNDR